ncbi:MAG TPA: hypothetical protein VMS76_09080 [Planctomycetota bacterium]|nr:hypothetical protein [Planctomycetota bacterium]
MSNTFLGPVAAALFMVLTGLSAGAQTQVWIKQIGDLNQADGASACAPDASGGVYLAGWTEGNLGGPQAGSNDPWVARYDVAGNQLWIRQFGTSLIDVVFGAAPDDVGGVYVCGVTTGSLGGPQAGNGDAWLARYDSAGNQLWIRQLGSSADDRAQFASADGAGGVYIGGWTYGNLGGMNPGGFDCWFARYDAAGNQLWVRQLGTSMHDYGLAAAPDGLDGVYVCGSTTGSLAAPNVPGDDDAWLARYDGSGNQVWILQFGGDLGAGAFGAAPDGTGGVYVAGGVNVGIPDTFVARFDSAGNRLWIRQFGSSAYDRVYARVYAAAGGASGVYLAGSTLGSLGGPNAGKEDAWLARYDSAGNQLWILQLGTSEHDRANAAAIHASGGVYVAGETLGDLAAPNFNNMYDGWLARFDEPCAGWNYCTAKTNSAGCVPSITASGMVSASAGSGFTLTTKNLLANKFGIYFYSKGGQQLVPFQGGTLCTKAPLVRTMLQNSGGMPPCGGSFQIDFNAYIASGKDPGLVAGQQVWVQTWSRDPGFAPPNNTSLSDAVTFTICP